MYFEYDFPKMAPKYLRLPLSRVYEEVAARVSERMDKLEAALKAATKTAAMTNAQFAATAKKVFDSVSVERFDSMTSEDLANAVTLLFDGSPAEPRIEFPDAITVVDASFITVQEWEIFRHLGIGGSDAAAIQGSNPYTTARALYSNKVGIPVSNSDNDGAPQFARGHEMEPKVIKAFEKLTGATVIQETRMFRSAWFASPLADVDALVRLKDGKLYVFEAKTTVKNNKYHWSLGGQGQGYVPPYYLVQCRQYPGVLASEEIAGTIIGCLFVDDTTVANEYLCSSYDERDFIYRVIPRDLDEELRILQDDDTFYGNYVLNGIVPPINTTVKAKGNQGRTTEELADLKLLRMQQGDPDKEATPVDLDEDDMRDLAEKYLDLADQKASLEMKLGELTEQQKQIQAMVIPKLSGAAFGHIPQEDDDDLYYEVKYVLQGGRPSVDTKLMAEMYPDAYGSCVTRTSSPRFSITVRSKKKEAEKAERQARKARRTKKGGPIII